MQCFIHPSKEAMASCTKCGKAMCVDCSSFSNHIGVCPACRKTDMDKEITDLERLNKGRRNSLRTRLIVSIIFFFLILPLVLYPSYKRKINREISITEDKIASIQKSLRFVDEALKRGSGSLSESSPESEEICGDDAWQCTFCRTINKGTRTCKFCARKKA